MVKIRIGIENYYEVYNIKNNIFNKDAYKIGENLEYPFVTLRDKLNALEIKIDTLDMYPLDEYDKVIFLDVPKKSNIKFKRLKEIGKSKLYLVILESEIIKKDNWVKKNHIYFDKVFTWNNDLVDDNKYIKFFLPNKIPDKFDFKIDSKEKLCTMIAGNKANKDSRELYSERLNDIRWFEKNHPEHFDLYGFGWDERNFSGKIINKLNMIKLLKKAFVEKHPNYKGKVESKNDILKKYKYAICYENVKDISGYITEKIFDCFFAGCVPIYWGAPNILDYIPKSTFIDRREFKNIAEVYNYINNMDENIYLQYISSIEKFLKSDAIKKFSGENFAETIIENIVK